MKTQRFPNDGYGTRLAVLEQIAKETTETLKRLENKIEHLSAESWSQFRWLLGIIFTLSLANTATIVSILSKIHS